MSQFLRHDQCPRCFKNGKDRRGNNLAVYSDHVYCFGCGYSKQSKHRERNEGNSSQTEAKLPNLPSKDYKKCPSLPPDFVLSLSMDGYKWIKQYGITDRELAANHIGWSDNGFTINGNGRDVPIQYKPCMVFPVYDIYGNLLMWQARYFGLEKNIPKYITRGKPNDVYHIVNGNSGSTITVVEDLISAIKVGRNRPCMPIWGSHLSLSSASRLSRTYSKLIFWLDFDKAKEARRLAQKYFYLFKEGCEVTITQLDPKELNNE